MLHGSIGEVGSGWNGGCVYDLWGKVSIGSIVTWNPRGGGEGGVLHTLIVDDGSKVVGIFE